MLSWAILLDMRAKPLHRPNFTPRINRYEECPGYTQKNFTMTYHIDVTVEREYSLQELLDLWNGIAKPMWRTEIPTLDEVIEDRNTSMQFDWEELLQSQDEDIDWLDENNESYFRMSVIKWENAVKFI